jgi:hypothetical protein
VQTGTAPEPGEKEIPWPWPKYAFYKGEPMSQTNPMENPAHIARQLAAILEQTAKIANALASIANVAALPPASVGGAQPLVMNPPAGGPICPVCGDKEKPSNYSRKDGKTTYCLTCHIKKKEAKR